MPHRRGEIPSSSASSFGVIVLLSVFSVEVGVQLGVGDPVLVLLVVRLLTMEIEVVVACVGPGARVDGSRLEIVPFEV
jgi:hypothetical protein